MNSVLPVGSGGGEGAIHIGLEVVGGGVEGDDGESVLDELEHLHHADVHHQQVHVDQGEVAVAAQLRPRQQENCSDMQRSYVHKRSATKTETHLKIYNCESYVFE